MTRRIFFSLNILPLLFIFLFVFKIIDDSVSIYSGLQYGGVSGFFSGQPANEPNYGWTSEALGRRAALDVFSGDLPLWNHYEGFGTPLLGEMQSAALFPPTWLLAFPHGQALEQGLLQILAGLGTWLFLRKLGLCSKSALVGAILFQFNGVFAWLRNAVYNPVAFLPWLFLTVEILYASAKGKARMAKRLPTIALGGMAAALAIYAGFPEEVYLYSLLLLVWALFRLFAVNRPARPRFILDLGLVCLVGLLLSLPILLAFAAFLPEAMLGMHNNNSFSGVHLPPSAPLQALFPYVYGPIAAAKNPVIFSGWAAGGYIGLVPCILALAALFFSRRRAIKLLAVAWIVLATGVTFGVPGIHQAFQALPLMKITAAHRYLDASWIFCFVILAGLALDDIRQAKISDVRRALGKAVVLVVTLLAVAAALAWPVLAQLGTEVPGIMHAALLSAGAALAIVSGTAFLAARARPSRLAGMLGVFLILEALVNFAVPFFSFPRHSKLDEGSIAFIKENLGFQRVIGSESASITPNYGSYFGFSLLNWDDLPVPKTALDYVRRQLDPFLCDGLMYRVDSNRLTALQCVQREVLFRQRLDRYAQAGVKYITSRTQPAALSFFPERQNDNQPLVLSQSQHLEIIAPFTQEEKMSLTGLSVLIGTYSGASDGKLAATVCNAGECAQGVSDLATAGNNVPLEIRLDRPLAVAKGDAIKIVFEKEGGVHPVALWMAMLPHSSEDIRVQTDGGGLRPGTAPSIEFRDLVSDKARLVYSGINFDLYELSGVQPYFEAEGCSLTATNRDEVKASCVAPSRLTRLELSMPGWLAYVDDAEVKIERVREIFQQVALPKGDSTVRFVFMPTGMRAAILVSAGTLAAVLFILGYAVIERFRAPKNPDAL